MYHDVKLSDMALFGYYSYKICEHKFPANPQFFWVIGLLLFSVCVQRAQQTATHNSLVSYCFYVCSASRYYSTPYLLTDPESVVAAHGISN